MFCFLVGVDNRCGIVSNCRVSEGSRAPCGRVRSTGLDEADEIVGTILIVGNVEEEGVQHITEGGEIIVRWLADNWLEGGSRRGKERGDLLRGHGDGREAREKAGAAAVGVMKS